MASLTKNPNESDAPSEEPEGSEPETAGEEGEPSSRSASDSRAEPPRKGPPGTTLDYARQPAGGGYFHVYKKGQGYWTRMGTVGGVVLVGGLTINFLWGQSTNVSLEHAQLAGFILCGAFALVYGIFAWIMLNKPGNVDFLIATDSEMKKVSWASKKDLIGSTRVVILFMFVVAIVLFCFDMIFAYLFYLIGVLKTSPF